MKATGKRFCTFTVAAAIVAVGMLSALAPTASAHYCKSYDDECDPNGCVEGKYHDHTRMYHWKEDERCISEEKKEDPKPGRCENKPLVEKLICILIGDYGANTVTDKGHKLN